MPENERLLPLAGAVADGREVDWRLAEAEALGDEERTMIRHLRLLADVADLHRSGASCVNEADGPTLDGPPTRKRSPGPAKTWGPLRLIERVGTGACGDVWRAWDPRLDRQVALKLYRGCERDVSAVVEEGRMLARVRHPNIVMVHGAERIGGHAGLWMEFIDGRTLEELVTRQGPFGPKEAALIGLDVCRAMAATHGSGLVHGDVKASNVMREEGGRIVLMDLSAAKEAHGQDGSRSLSGTPLYMSPELLRGEAATPRSDIYSLGVLLYHLVTGSFPVRGKSLADLAQAHEKGERRLLRDVRPDLPEAFVRVVERSIAPDAAERFESAGCLEAELALVVAQTGSRDGSRPPARRASAHKVLSGLAASLLIVVAAWTLRQQARPSPVAVPVQVANLAQAQVSRTAELPAATKPEPYRSPKAPSKAPSLATNVGASNAREEVAAADYSVQAVFHRHEDAGDVALLPGARVAPGDRLFLEFQASRDLHLYVMNEDEHGAAFLLFPLPGQDLSNPLPAGARNRVPGQSAGLPVYWQVTSSGGRERFLLVASPQPLPEVEAEIAALDRPQFGQTIAAPLENALFDRVRGLGGLVVESGRGAGESGHIARLAQYLAARPETVRGAWVRQFDLEN